MKLKILYLILFILIFIPIGLCEIIKDDINLNNTKIYDKNNEIISIYDKNNEKSMDIKLISTSSDITKFIKIVEITNYIEYIPDRKKDFITNTKKIYGKNDVYKIECFIEKYNYTFENIVINKTIFNNKTGKNEIKLINKSIVKDIKSFWVEFKPYNKQIFKNETFKLKIIHHKKPELGFFKIQTTPIFKNIECKEFTWWLGNWNLKRPILINNTYGDNVTDYQLRSINLSEYKINASSTRIINESSGLIQNHWNKLIDDNGNLEYVWCNFSKIINNTWINNTYYIYYQNNPVVNSISNGNKTFNFFDDFFGSSLDINKWVPTGIITVSNSIVTIGTGSEKIVSVNSFLSTITEFKIKWIVGTGDPRSGFSKTDQSRRCYAAQYLNCFYLRNISGTNIVLTNDWLDNTWNTIKISRNVLIPKVWWYENNVIATNSPSIINVPIENLNLYFSTTENAITYIDWVFVRKYTLNEPELWTVGNIEYPEVLNMTCNLEIITHLTEKEIKIINMTGDIINISKTNECINLSYDSYIVYMSNPVKIDSMTSLLNILDNILVQFLLFIFLIIIATLFYVFIQIVKKKGFKGVIK